ncbi:hypothetical protein [Amycolatopsis australiensis]|uniref:Uncharacterized protein n=1 Tax=Amycolatopsis australiensis TaxID=546364 RepID=A0A1K1T2B5_9PSEU|nr:hypothetical protein [Amycolatopsis australiensis]SFW90785.1 hypothetical protein SAMN04489730_7701 [Amycolatopsis australiensis]
MIQRYIKFSPIVLVVAVVGIIIGLVMHAKNSSQAQACGTTFHTLEKALSSTYRATCSTATSLSGIGMAIVWISAAVAAVVVVAAIVHFMQRDDQPST